MTRHQRPGPATDGGRGRPPCSGSARLSDRLLKAIAVRTPTPEWTAAEVRSALWRVANLPGPVGRGASQAVAAAMAHIDSHLGERLLIPHLAAVAGVSHNHLTRLFRAETGGTVVAYIRRRRMERDAHLLRETALPVPAVAASVGIGGVQQDLPTGVGRLAQVAP